jgi:hypothetical protein
MSNPVDDLGNVQVAFVWGNIPMQPDDARPEGKKLDPALDNHIIATTRYNGFPGYTPEPPFLDTIANVAVPNVLNLTESAATTALTGAGLVKGAVTTSAVGATTTNDGKVKTQTPANGTVVNTGTSVALVLFLAPTVPSVLGLTEAAATSALTAAGLVKGTVTTSTDGATEGNDGTVKSQSPVSGGKADTGSAVDLVLFNFEG